MGKKTKQEILNEIARIIGGDFPVSTGSTEPKAVVEALIRHFGLRISPTLTKPEAAERIAAYAGVSWDSSCDSRGTPSGGGSTITHEGLLRLLEAARILDRRRRGG